MKATTAEHIQHLENKRAVLAARMGEIMRTAAGDDRTCTEEESTEHDGLGVQVKSLDADLGRWREHERLQLTTATAVPATLAPVRTATLPTISVRPNVPIGTQFVRAACAKLIGAMENRNPAEIAQERWGDSTPEVALYLKAAVAAGNTTDATWALPLVNQNIATDFLELLRPATILGRIPGLRNVPFNVKVPSQTAGGTYGWVGESKPKPVTKLAFSAETLGVNKVAGIIVLTEELVRLSNPKAEELVKADMIAGIARFLDQQFTDPAVAAVAGVNPASITNGAPTAAATTNPLADIMGLINHFATNNIPVDGLTFIMSPANALALSFRSNLDGSPQYPGLSISGGNYRGINFVTSNTVAALVIALQPSQILYADDGGVTIDASREASLQMDSAPMSPVDATTVMVSLWQANCVGLRAERFVDLEAREHQRGEVPDGRGVSGPGGHGVRRTAGRRPARPARGAPRKPVMELFGFDLTLRRKGLPLQPVAASWPNSSWPIVVREPYTGAWQHNEEIRLDTALSNPTVFRCVSLIAGDIAKTPLRLVALDADGIWTETSSPAFSPVLRKPNRYQTIGQFLEAWMFSKLLTGNTYVLKDRDERGVVTALYVLDPAKVTPLVSPDGSVYYQLKQHQLAGVPDDQLAVPAREIIHDRWNCAFHPLVGLSPLYACGGAALQANTIQTQSTEFFSKGGRPSGLLVAPTEIDPKTVERLSDDLAFPRPRQDRDCRLRDEVSRHRHDRRRLRTQCAA